jgi:hypothetical protein
MNETHKQAILAFEDEWRRYRAFTSGLLMRETPLDEADLARLMDAVNQITLARGTLDAAPGIGAGKNHEVNSAPGRVLLIH